MKIVVAALLVCGVMPIQPAMASAASSCPCPASNGAESGSEPLAVVGQAGVPLFIACGYRESKAGVFPVVASEFEVFRCGNKAALISFDGTETCILTEEKNHLVITETEKWPFAPGWKWVDVPVRQYVVANDSPGLVAKTMVLKAPVLSQRQIGDALDYYARHIHRRGLEEDYEDVIGRVLAAAVAGNGAARQALAEMPATLNLDGEGAEVYQEAVALYNSTVAAGRQLPDLGNP
jgi:hypothetical protein